MSHKGTHTCTRTHVHRWGCPNRKGATMERLCGARAADTIKTPRSADQVLLLVAHSLSRVAQVSVKTAATAQHTRTHSNARAAGKQQHVLRPPLHSNQLALAAGLLQPCVPCTRLLWCPAPHTGPLHSSCTEQSAHDRAVLCQRDRPGRPVASLPHQKGVVRKKITLQANTSRVSTHVQPVEMQMPQACTQYLPSRQPRTYTHVCAHIQRTTRSCVYNTALCAPKSAMPCPCLHHAVQHGTARHSTANRMRFQASSSSANIDAPVRTLPAFSHGVCTWDAQVVVQVLHAHP